jgi:phage shock protein A
MTHRTGLVGRFLLLVRGTLSGWLRDRENESPRVVYEQAIRERAEQYRELKSAVAGILYMRNKLEAEIQERRVEIARTHDDIRRGIRSGEDDAALALISHKQSLVDELARAERELEGLRSEAEEAKGNLLRFREEIRGLEREKGRALALLASARARRRLTEALDGLSVEPDLRALENVREHIAHLATEGVLDRELTGGRDDVQLRIATIREEGRRDLARRELEELKRDLRGAALPAAAG